MNEDALLSTREVAELLGISSEAVHRLCHRGSLASAWVNGARVFRRQAILAFRDNPLRERLTRRRREPR